MKLCQVGWDWRVGNLNIARNNENYERLFWKVTLYNKHSYRKGTSCFKERSYGLEIFNYKPEEYNSKALVFWWYQLLWLWGFLTWNSADACMSSKNITNCFREISGNGGKSTFHTVFSFFLVYNIMTKWLQLSLTK